MIILAHKTYIKHTDSKKAVLFIHGFLGSPEHFEKYIENMPDDCAVYNILLKGHGGTVREFGNASMREWKQQISDVINDLLGKYEEIIICAHSMGTFFAMEEAIKHPHKIKALFLLAIPLKIGVKFTAFVNTLKSFFNIIPECDEKGQAYKTAHSVKLNKRIWEYIGWIPRYLELFAESKRSRDTILNVKIPCKVILSEQDELVSIKSVKYIPKNDNMELHILPDSGHFIYNKDDYSYILKEFNKYFETEGFYGTAWE